MTSVRHVRAALLILCVGVTTAAQDTPSKNWASFPVDGIRNGAVVFGSAGAVLHVDNVPQNDLTQQQVAALRRFDESLANSSRSADRMRAAVVLQVLARSGDEQALLYLHEIYESNPSRRNDVADALTYLVARGTLRLPDWRVLVRSLKTVEGDQARRVLEALARFRQRANRPSWIRQTILVGQRQDPAGQTAARKLLEHWTGLDPDDPKKKPPQTLADWSVWFAVNHPDEPPAHWPNDPPNSRWKYATLQERLSTPTPQAVDIAAGQAALKKGLCLRCHRFGGAGEKFGPDLTHVARRLQQKEILLATMFPSHDLMEEYPSILVLTDQGTTHTGLLAGVTADTLTLVRTDGSKLELPRAKIDEIQSKNISIMPAGLLEPLTLDEIKALFALLNHPPEAE